MGGGRGAARAQVLQADALGARAAARNEGGMAGIRGEDRPADARGRNERTMNLSDTGESRVNGYLFVLERSLKSFLPTDVVRDATREIESHVRERVASHNGAPNEREALE